MLRDRDDPTPLELEQDARRALRQAIKRELTPVTADYIKWEDDKASLADDLTRALEALRTGMGEQEAQPEGEQEEGKGEVLGVTRVGVELFLHLTGLGQAASCEMGWVVKHIVKPFCGRNGEKAMLDMFAGVRFQGEPAVARMEQFHSYTWRECVADTVGGLADYHWTCLWWDIFCQNQFVAGNVAETFQNAIDQCYKILMSVPHPAMPTYLCRVWCLFELLTATKQGKSVAWVSSNSLTEADFAALEAAEKVFRVDLAKAEATRPEDVTMIHDFIAEKFPEGIPALNKQLFGIFKNSILEENLRAAGFM